MRVTVAQKTLAEACGQMVRIVNNRVTIPILANVKLVAADGGLRLRATNLDMEIEARVPAVTEPADGEREAATTVSAHRLADIVRGLAASDVALDFTDTAERLKVQGGRSRFNLAVLPARDFPDLPPPAEVCRFTMPAAVLARMIRKTSFAAAKKDTRIYLEGIHFEIADSALHAVASDGYRMSTIREDMPEGAEAMPGFLLSAKSAGELAGICDAAGESGEVAISVADTVLVAETGGMRLTTKLLDATFPEIWRRMLPMDNPNVCVVNREDLRKAVSLVTLVSNPLARNAVRAEAGPEGIRIAAFNHEAGDGESTLACDFEGEAVQTGFGGQQLGDLLGNIDGERVRLAFGGPGDSMLLRNAADSDGGHLCVIQPMKA